MVASTVSPATRTSGSATGALGARFGAVAMAVAGLLFLLYPVIRPRSDSAATIASGNWVAAHQFAMIGFVLFGLALYALRWRLDGTRGARLSGSALVVGWIGAGLTLPYYGAEDYALHALAQESLRRGDGTLMTVVDSFRFSPVAVTTFGAGLVLLGVGASLAAAAIWRSGRLAAWSGVPLALGFLLFIPQFYGGPELRIVHGALMLVGSLWVAVELWRARRAATA